MKLSLTDPLIQLISYSHIRKQMDSVGLHEEDLDSRRVPCNSCAQQSKNLIFKKAVGTEHSVSHPWINLNCDALVRCHQFIQRNNMQASDLLDKIHPYSTEPDDIYNASNNSLTPT